MKTGPTPSPDAPAATVARRVPSAVLLEVAVPLPPPLTEWGARTLAAYHDYAESQAARVLRAEDVQEVVVLFELIDRRTRYLADLTGGAEDDLKALQAIRLVESMIDRKASNLGIGPLARTRLGIARLEQGAKLKATQDAHPSSDF